MEIRVLEYFLAVARTEYSRQRLRPCIFLSLPFLQAGSERLGG